MNGYIECRYVIHTGYSVAGSAGFLQVSESRIARRQNQNDEGADMERILIIEDDDVLAQGVKFNLELAGFSFAGSLRKEREIPVIFLTARDLDEDMMRGFEIGADDYITKPFNVLILVQRVRAVLKRYHAGSRKRERVKTGNLEIDFQSWQVWKSGVELTLTPTEFRLLKKFCDNPGIVLTRRVLLETMWDKEEKFVDEHTLIMFVSRIRSKISDEEHSYIRTVYGTGYQWMGK